MTIESVMYVEIEPMVPMAILLRINDGVYVCICSVYSKVLKEHTQHTFFYDSYFSKKVKSACRGEIIDNRRHAPICVMEGKDIDNKDTLKNMLRNFFQGTSTVNYAFKVTSSDSP